MNRTFCSKIEFSITDAHFKNPVTTDYVDIGDWRTIRADLYEESGEEYVYINRDSLEEIFEANSISVGVEADVTIDLDEIDLADVDTVNLSIT